MNTKIKAVLNIASLGALLYTVYVQNEVINKYKQSEAGKDMWYKQATIDSLSSRLESCEADLNHSKEKNDE
jgi:hypothetical protein